MSLAETISVARIAKVNHAGEYGAIRIYGAQMMVARVLWPSLVPLIVELRGHEVRHCTLFRQAMRDRNTRPCRAMVFWSWGGFALGFVTAFLGPKAVWACTEAVEATVHHHLTAQLAFLHGRDQGLFDLITSIRAEEEGHLALAIQEKGSTSGALRALEGLVRLSVHAVVWLSTWGESSRMSRDLSVVSA